MPVETPERPGPQAASHSWKPEPETDPRPGSRKEEYKEHPGTELLEGLLRNELSAADRRRVVRHLLTGCPQCAAVARRGWPFGSLDGRGSKLSG
jgi:hypothetical protein